MTGLRRTERGPASSSDGASFFREWDVVLCPPMSTPAFPHDHRMPYSVRRIEIDGKEYPYFDQLVWPEIATTPGLPATAIPIDRSEPGLPIGVQIVGPYLVLLSQSVAAFVDRNHIFEKTHFSAWGRLRWVWQNRET